jgi:hypothetical protein
VPGFVEGYRGGYQDRWLIAFHESCMSSATNAAQARRMDVSTPEFTRKIERSCSCVADAVKSGSVTTAEVNAFSANPQADDPTAVKVRELVASCLR